MLRVRKTRSSLLGPALLVELAAETGTVLCGVAPIAGGLGAGGLAAGPWVVSLPRRP